MPQHLSLWKRKIASSGTTSSGLLPVDCASLPRLGRGLCENLRGLTSSGPSGERVSSCPYLINRCVNLLCPLRTAPSRPRAETTALSLLLVVHDGVVAAMEKLFECSCLLSLQSWPPLRSRSSRSEQSPSSKGYSYIAGHWGRGSRRWYQMGRWDSTRTAGDGMGRARRKRRREYTRGREMLTVFLSLQASPV